MKIHEPDNSTPINTIWVFMSEDENGNEGIVGTQHCPLITGTENLLPTMKRIAMHLRPLVNKKIKLVKFCSKETVEYL